MKPSNRRRAPTIDQRRMTNDKARNIFGQDPFDSTIPTCAAAVMGYRCTSLKPLLHFAFFILHFAFAFLFFGRFVDISMSTAIPALPSKAQAAGQSPLAICASGLPFATDFCHVPNKKTAPKGNASLPWARASQRHRRQPIDMVPRRRARSEPSPEYSVLSTPRPQLRELHHVVASSAATTNQ